VDKPAQKPPKRAFIRIPPNWKDLTEEQKQAAGLEMARALQRQLLPAAPEPPTSQGTTDDAGRARSRAKKGPDSATGTTRRRRPRA